MSLVGTVEKVLATAEKLGTSEGNETQTRVLLVEPLLAALGWDTADPDQVVREYRVYDGTALDFALKIDGEPRLFLEAKAVGKQLEDSKFISQTVNYANNEGVVWCVLSNGLNYRVYKTNEPVGMAEKLLFEIDLREAGGASDLAQSLQLLGREAIMSGALESWGDQVFTDKRVREALISLAKKPPAALVSVLHKAVGKPAVTQERLQESLARILDVADGAKTPSVTGSGPKPPQAPKKPAGKKQFGLDHHLNGKPAAMVDLFEQVDEFGRSLGADVSRRITKFYVGYFAGKRSFITVEIQRQRLIVYLNLDPSQASPWNDQAMRDVREIGHYGMGDTEYSLRGPAQLDEAKGLIQRAYERTR